MESAFEEALTKFAQARDNKRLEEYRKNLKSSLQQIMDNADKVIDMCYGDKVTGIDITIRLEADDTFPKVSYHYDTFIPNHREGMS